jgi:hypothetical protein
LTGKKASDVAAEVATLRMPVVSDWASHSNVYAFLHYVLPFLWEVRWTSTWNRNLHIVKPFAPVWHFCFIAVWKEEVMLTYLWVSHTYLTHCHLLCGELALVCINCGVTRLGGMPTLWWSQSCLSS